MQRISVFAIVMCLVSSVTAKTPEQWMEALGYDDSASYEATRVMETKEGRFSMKVRHAPQKEAMEMNMGGMQSTMIMRQDLGKSYAIMPSMGMYREMDMREAMQQSNQSMDLSSVEKVGEESVNGYDTVKYKTKFKDKEGKGAGFMWVTDAGVPIKMDMIYASRGMKGQRFKMELQDLIMRPQDPSHFEVPPGMQSMNMANMMQMGRRQQAAQGSATANEQPQEEYQQPSLAEEVGDAAKDETRRGVVNETREAVRKGLRGLFN